MNVVPFRPNVRFYCSTCDEHFYEYQRDKHEQCIEVSFCTCGRAFQPGDDECPMCGGKR